MALIALTYVSAAQHMMTSPELLEILKVSKENNRPLNITGMLLYRDGYFIQVLEGEEAAVVELFEKISQDDRHHHVLEVSREVIDNRSFGDWSMGYTNLEELEDPKSIPGYVDFLNTPFSIEMFQKSPSRATRLLQLFKDQAI